MKMQIPHHINAVYKNKKRSRLVAFFSSLNPFNWFNDLVNFKISLEEFDNINKYKPQDINTILKKDRPDNIFPSKLANAITTKNNFKIPCMMAFILLSSVALFAQYAGRQDNKKFLKNQASNAMTADQTPVYLGHKNHEVAILEKDFPKVAARFLKAFPSADKPLWIKEDDSFFAYFLNNGNKVTAVFTANGHMNYAVSIIGMFEVPEHIRDKIKKSYSSFSFFSAKKIHAGDYCTYELVFENQDEYISISTTDDDEIVVAGKMRKTTAYKKFANNMP